MEQDKESVYNLSSGQQYQGSADDLVRNRTMGQIACSLQPLNSTTQSNAKSRRCLVMLANPGGEKVPIMKL